MSFKGIVDLALEDMRQRSQKRLYQTDYTAWKADVLGFHTYDKMEGIMDVALFGDINRTVIKSSNGTSKDLALDTPLLTTKGWKTMETVEVGDEVFSEEGKPIKVSWKSEVFNKPSYLVKFDDGAHLVTSDSHEWNTLTLNERARIKTDEWREHWDSTTTRTTAEIATSLRNKTGSSYNHLIPLAKAIEMPERDQILPAYVLGAWIGDGTSLRAEMTCNYDTDGYVIDRIEELGYPMNRSEVESGKYRFFAVRNSRGGRNVPASEFKLALDELGVTNNKHIPEQYLYGSIGQRIELMRGLMDTDGWADARGASVGWSQSDPDLIGQFCDLLTSLGVRFSLTSFMPPIGKEHFVVRFNPKFDPFTPGERKSKVFLSSSKKQASRLTGRTVVSVTEVPSVPTQCIQVDSERHLYLAGSYLVPTHNSFELASAICWAASVFEPDEVKSIVSAPSEPQIKQVIFNYIKSNYQRAIDRGNQLQGFITEDMGWKAKSLAGNISLVYGRAPNPHDAVSTFQGVRSQHGMTMLWYEEAGGMQPQMWTAAQAIVTGGESRFIGIGNPDRMDTEFYNIFTENKYETLYNRFTISSLDLPTLTGERVYPRTTEGDAMEAQMMKNLTQASWVEDMKILWGENDARYQSKVLGEFSSLGSNAFFKPTEITESYTTEIEVTEEVRPVLGMDVGAEGEDETVVYGNWNGKLRFIESWGKNDSYESAVRVHEIALANNALAICIDSVGVGGGVVASLLHSPEFAGADYFVMGIGGADRSPEPHLWANMKTFNHEQLRKRMAAGQIDIDPNDEFLVRQLEAITYEINSRDRVMITPKARIRKIMGRSPDHLDAAVYSVYDVDQYMSNPNNLLKEGDAIVLDMVQAYELEVFTAAGRPF